MICPECRLDRKPHEFIAGNKDCYKCVYERKLKKIGPVVRLCRICNKECKNSRWIYCSRDCAEIGGTQQKKDYWTSNVKAV